MPEVPGKAYFAKMSRETGFKLDTLEKVFRIYQLLGKIDDAPQLRNKLALKGGTAIQSLVFGFRRLSIDIDFNYVAAVDKKTMTDDRPDVRKTLEKLAAENGYSFDRPDVKYAEEELHLGFINCGGGKDRIKIDINYLERLPLLGTQRRELLPFGEFTGATTLSFCDEELFAGKLRALLTRGTTRDLYDCSMIEENKGKFDIRKFRIITIAYIMMQDRDIREMSSTSIDSITEEDIRNNLRPTLSDKEEVDFEKMRGNALGLCNLVLQFTGKERAFLDKYYDEGKIDEALLVEDGVMTPLTEHPAIKWRLEQRKNTSGTRP